MDTLCIDVPPARSRRSAPSEVGADRLGSEACASTGVQLPRTARGPATACRLLLQRLDAAPPGHWAGPRGPWLHGRAGRHPACRRCPGRGHARALDGAHRPGGPRVLPGEPRPLRCVVKTTQTMVCGASGRPAAPAEHEGRRNGQPRTRCGRRRWRTGHTSCPGPRRARRRSPWRREPGSVTPARSARRPAQRHLDASHQPERARVPASRSSGMAISRYSVLRGALALGGDTPRRGT